MRIEIRSDSVVLDGYVNVVHRESREIPSPNGRFVEEILPKTFERALMKNDDVDLLFNHNKNRKLGSTKQGNLELREDNIGLRAIATVTDQEIIEKAHKGELRGWSFGFITLKDTWKSRENGVQKRYVEEIELSEVSVLDVSPAYIATSIEARGEEMLMHEQRNEDFDPKIEDNSQISTNHKQVKENREDSAQFDYTIYENEMTLLELKGALSQ